MTNIKTKLNCQNSVLFTRIFEYLFIILILLNGLFRVFRVVMHKFLIN